MASRACPAVGQPGRKPNLDVNFLSLIESKRGGLALSAGQLQSVVTEFVAGTIPDYQMSAFLMAVYFQGLNEEETRALTLAMRDSGEVLRFEEDPRPLVDKHSTGGVGDKVSLPLAPLLACLGFRVPMISGRGLGITGGTLDKLESIPGFKTVLPAERIAQIVQETGCVICGQTEHMVPADKKLYALRDVTGTVPSIPLIVASILSKKLAEGLEALVLDVKFGCAAFMQTRDEAERLASAMVQLGAECGVNTRAILSDMNVPLGQAAGNWLEVRESVSCLEGHGPDDLRRLVIDCAASLLLQTQRCPDEVQARGRAGACLDSGEPLRKWEEMLAAQGVAMDRYHEKLARAQTAPMVRELTADRSGVVQSCNARLVGEVVRDLGAGRLTKESIIQAEVGVDRLAKPGTPIRSGETLVRVHALNADQATAATRALAAAFRLAD
jgi:pyrimidine-nucleoside phosphorylase